MVCFFFKTFFYGDKSLTGFVLKPDIINELTCDRSFLSINILFKLLIMLKWGVSQICILNKFVDMARRVCFWFQILKQG